MGVCIFRANGGIYYTTKITQSKVGKENKRIRAF
jgi:hypothetical protein